MHRVAFSAHLSKPRARSCGGADLVIKLHLRLRVAGGSAGPASQGSGHLRRKGAVPREVRDEMGVIEARKSEEGARARDETG